jgi:hypothetical protein
MNLIEELASYSSDPYGFVLFAFPWGEPGELENYSGPLDWQIKVLQDLAPDLSPLSRLSKSPVPAVTALVSPPCRLDHPVGHLHLSRTPRAS